MKLKEKILRDAVDAANGWVSRHKDVGEHPFTALLSTGEFMQGLIDRVNWDDDAPDVPIPVELLARIITLAGAGRHVVVMQLLALGIVTEEEVDFHLEGNDDDSN